MEFQHIAIENLALSATNMRGGRKCVDLTNILPSIRARGILLPLIVRAVEDGAAGAYEIVAGKRRYLAAQIVAEEAGGIEPLPCAVMAAGDDAGALEVSLIENWARLQPSDVANWESFTRLVKEGRTPEDISLTFGLTELQVKRTLALGNLLPRIRSLYSNERIDAATVKHLTLATKRQQREWLALLDDELVLAPTGQQLKAWLFGGASITTQVALFDLATYPGEIVTDLFGEGGYFADAPTFWAAQNEAIAAKAEGYRETGWEVTILSPGEYFHAYEYERTAKRKGGKVYVAISQRGEVAFHEGYLSRKEARQCEKGASGAESPKPVRSEVTSTLASYIDLHRHAAVRARLADAPGIAVRVMVAHSITGSHLFSVKPDPRRAANDAVAESAENSSSEAAFDAKRRTVLASLGFDGDTPTVIGGDSSEYGVSGLLMRLIELPDAAVMEVLAIVMGEALECGSAVVESLGVQLGVDMADSYAADAALLDLIRDKQVLNEIVREVAGDAVADANANETGTVQRGIVRDCLTGENGRAKVERFVPRWMAFPPAAYTERGGVPTVRQWSRVADQFAPAEAPELEAVSNEQEASQDEIEHEPMLEAAE